MEIKNSLLKNVDPYRTAVDSKNGVGAARADKSGNAAQTSAPQGDRVSLSPSAMLHTVAHSVASKAPEIRQEKIDSIKERIAAGEYTINSKNIAEKLLQSDALLAGTVKE